MKGVHLASQRKIAVVIGQLMQGGSERQLYMFLEQCDRNRWEPLVYVSGELGFWEQPIRNLGMPVTLLEGNPITKMLQFRSECVANNIKHFFSWSSYTNGFGLALAGLRIHRVGSFRNDLFADLPEQNRWLWSWMSVAGISSIVCNSQEVYTLAQRRFGKHKQVVYVPNGIQILQHVDHYRKIWRERLGLENDEVLVVGVGRLTSQKNFARFIDTIAIVNRTMPVRAVIAGKDDGCLASLQHKLAMSGLGMEDLRFIGPVPDARELICAADIFLLSSDYEGMPNVVLEAMAAGVPCVCSQVNGVSDLLEKSQTGFVVDPSAELLAQKILQLARNKTLRQAMGTRARAIVEECCDPQVVAHRLWQLCD
jgi:glycosyltransferase involved in cell wall biosynthesis